jgi:tetratricopeptide (TPR) repeat protein
MGRSNDLLEDILENGPSLRMYRRVLEQMKADGHTREVVGACVRGLEQDPDDMLLRRLLAQCYKDMGFFSLYENEMFLVTENIEKLISIFKEQARLFAQQGRAEEASGALKKYLAHYPGDDEALELLDGLEKTGRDAQEDAVSASHEAMLPETEPERIFPEMATHTLAEIYVTQGQHQAAMETYQELLARDPEDQKARERLQELEGGMDLEELMPEPVSGESLGKEKMISVLEGWLAGIRTYGANSIS